MAAHARLKNEFTEEEKCHNLMRWLDYLKPHPETIFIVDESGISTEHSAPTTVWTRDSSAQSVTSPMTFNVTIIAGWNALGNHVPPYYVFPGKWWNGERGDEMSSTGWSNSLVFNNYLTKRFAKYAGITHKTGAQQTLVLYDGHKSYAQLKLTNWAKYTMLSYLCSPHIPVISHNP